MTVFVLNQMEMPRMNGTVDACLTVTEGPVIISGLGSAAVDATHTLWDCIVASEKFLQVQVLWAGAML